MKMMIHIEKHLAVAAATLLCAAPILAQDTDASSKKQPSAKIVADPEYQKAILAALKKAGENAPEIEQALIRDLPKNQAKAVQFLVAHMPERDLKSLKADYILKNVAWAYKARETFPWAKQVPEDVFLNDVLPYASLNERRDDWREDFYNRFSVYVKNAKTQQEALEAVNKHILNELKVKYSTKRKKADQSPYESMEQGLASCTGLSILLNNALRSVGIPSRVAGTPAWTTKRGNHNWVEVWTTADKQWHFTEYYPDKKGLDHGWLIGDAARANKNSIYHSIYASSWKPTGKHFPLVWNMRIRYVHAVNVTDRYVALGGDAVKKDEIELRIHFMADKKRTAVPLAVLQGDAKLGEGSTPKVTDDMNRYFTVKARKGQIYTIAWTPPGTENLQRRQITTPKDKAWFTINLGEQK